MVAADNLPGLLEEIRACNLCAEHLPLGPRPVLRAAATARILIVGQAPGTRVHESGIPWNDRSGERLRAWMNVDKRTFYDESRIAIVPIAFCYPGRDAQGGDLPPRPECANEWHGRLGASLPYIKLTILAGGYAHRRYLGGKAKKNVTETVRAWASYRPGYLPTPHPSWRTTAWEKRNPWFANRVLPELRRRVRELL